MELLLLYPQVKYPLNREILIFLVLEFMSIKATETVIFHYESVINGRIQIRLTSGYLIKCQPKQMSGYLITLCKIPTKIVISMF